MKKFNSYKKSGFTLVQLVVMVAVLGLLAAIALPQAARAADQQGYAATTGSLTNVPVAAGTNAASASTNNYIPVTTRSGLALQATTTAAATFVVYPSVDGTNALAWSLATLAGTGPLGTNWSELTLRGFAGVFVSFTNTANASNTVNTFWRRPNL